MEGGGPSPRTAENIEYIRLLEHRNRMKKTASAASKSMRRLQHMEQGFELHFGGANEERNKQRCVPRVSNMDTHEGTRLPAQSGVRRRTWAKARAEKSNFSGPGPKELVNFGNEESGKAVVEEAENFADDVDLPEDAAADTSKTSPEVHTQVDSKRVARRIPRFPCADTCGDGLNQHDDAHVAATSAKSNAGVHNFAPCETGADETLLNRLICKVGTLNRSQQELLVLIASAFSDEHAGQQDEEARTKDDAIDDSEAATIRQCMRILKRLDKGTTSGSTVAAEQCSHESDETNEVPQVPIMKRLPTRKAGNPCVWSSALVLRIHDGWDVPRVAGLDAIEIYGRNGRLTLQPADLRLFAGIPPRPAPATSRSAAELPRLLSTPESSSEFASKSWIVRLPTDGPVELHVRMPDDFRLSPNEGTFCRIWNCSATSGKTEGLSSTPGALGSRRMDVEVNGQQIWCGELTRFRHHRDGRQAHARSDVLDVPLCISAYKESAAEDANAGGVSDLRQIGAEQTAPSSIRYRHSLPGSRAIATDSDFDWLSEAFSTAPQPAASTGNTAPEGEVTPLQTNDASQDNKAKSAVMPIWLSDKDCSTFSLGMSSTNPAILNRNKMSKTDAADEALSAMRNAFDNLDQNIESQGNSVQLSAKADLDEGKQNEGRTSRRRRPPAFNTVATNSEVHASAVKEELTPAKTSSRLEGAEAIESELHVMSPLSQKANLMEKKLQPQSHNGSLPQKECAIANSKGQTSHGNDDSLQQSWDSLTYFSKKSRSRLSQAGSAIVGMGLPINIESEVPVHGSKNGQDFNERESTSWHAYSSPIVDLKTTKEATKAKIDGAAGRDSDASTGGSTVKATSVHDDHHGSGRVDDLALFASQFESFANSIEDSAHASFIFDREGCPSWSGHLHPSCAETYTKTNLNAEAEGQEMVKIPTLPRGRVLRLELLSTWGDPYYIGLHGVEVFDEFGQQIKPASIAATPPSINVLPEYDTDPRTADKLIDGIFCTCDELHAWLAPFEIGQDHSITIELADIADPAPALSMLRIWNYNKSRAHSYRGVRRVRASLDSKPVFDGEIRKAPGALETAASCSEMILFTLCEKVLSKIEQNDKTLSSEDDVSLLREAHQLLRARPKTAEASNMLQRVALETSTMSYSDMLIEEGLRREATRPRTCVPREDLEQKKAEARFDSERAIDYRFQRAVDQAAIPSERDIQGLSASDELILSACEEFASKSTRDFVDQRVVSPVRDDLTSNSRGAVHMRKITFRLLSTWGDRHYIGLSGVKIYADAFETEVKMQPSQVSAEPRDLVSLGYKGDPRTIDKIVDGVTETVDDRHFWLVPFSTQTPPWLCFDLGTPTLVWGFGISNYNKSPEDALRGVRLLQIEIDGMVKGAVELRPAPGRGRVDYHQRIALIELLSSSSVAGPTVKEETSPTTSKLKCGALVCQVAEAPSPPDILVLDDYETPELPRGALLRIVLHNTWGDAYYVGLDRLELRDANHKIIAPERVFALPESIRVLGDDFTEDPRVPQNLFRDENRSAEEVSECSTTSFATSWLAPNRISLPDSEFPGYPDENELYICLRKPTSLSAVTVWNYTKTPSRGAREMSLWIDGSLVARVRLRRGDDALNGQHILFTPERFKASRRATRQSDAVQDVLCIDENQVRIRSRTMFDTDICAEGVFSSQMQHTNRPATCVAGDDYRH